MSELKPWEQSHIDALSHNVNRKLSVENMGLFFNYLELHPEIDNEGDLTPEQQADWLQYSTPILAEYEENKRRAIAKLPRAALED